MAAFQGKYVSHVKIACEYQVKRDYQNVNSGQTDGHTDK